MTRNLILVAAGILLAAGCENRAERERAQAEQAQQSANEKASEAQREANQKIANAQRQATEQQTKAAEALAKERNDIREGAQKELTDIDKKVVDLRQKAPPATKHVDVNMIQSEVQSRREAVTADLQRLDGATAQNVDEVKGQIDRDLDALKKSVNDWQDKVRGGKTTTTTGATVPGPTPQNAPPHHSAPHK